MNHRKPTALKLIAGNPGRRPLPENEPQPEPGAEMPDWLTEEARVHWPQVAKQLEDNVGVLTRMDQVALAIYCEKSAQYKEAHDRVVKHGTIVKSPNGFPMQSPFLAIETGRTTRW